MKKLDPKKFIKLGDCRTKNLIEDIFGSVTDFAFQVEENGDNFIYGNIKVVYDEKTDVHHFYELSKGSTKIQH